MGMEGMLSYGHRWNEFGWNSNFTFSWNKNKIIELVKDFHHPETGKILNIPELEMNGLGYSRFILKEGGTWATSTLKPTLYVMTKVILRWTPMVLWPKMPT